MELRTEFFQPATYRSLMALEEVFGSYYAVEDVEFEVGYSDVEDLLEAKEEDFLNMARRYVCFSAAQEPAFEYDMTDPPEKIREQFDEAITTIAYGYIEMQNHMKKAIAFKNLADKEHVSFDEIANAGIRITPASVSDEELRRELGRYLSRTKALVNLMADTIISEATELYNELRKPRFSFMLPLASKDTPYLEHLERGVIHAEKLTEPAYLAEISKNERSLIVTFGRFDNSPAGYRKAAERALDTLFAINLADISLVTRKGLVEQKALSIYSALWFHLARGLEKGRATRCEACSKPFIVFNERGMRRRYCSEACKKWAQRHPGEKRKTMR